MLGVILEGEGLLLSKESLVQFQLDHVFSKKK